MAQEFSSRRGKRFIYGLNVVRQACKNQRVIELLIDKEKLENFQLQKLVNLAKSLNLNLSLTNDKVLDEISDGQNHQGVAARVLPPPTLTLDQLLTEAKEAGSVILLLDGITDPQNFGAILRTAESAGVKGVIVEKHRSAPINDLAVNSSAGATELVPVAKVSNLKYAITALKKIGFWIYATDVGAKTNFWDINFAGQIGIIMGSEGKGIRSSIAKYCDDNFVIPMSGEIESLNVSVSAAVVLYEILRQKTCGK
jgi:23S rRNA (guanosine2251-2'-O)-methyltransferase